MKTRSVDHVIQLKAMKHKSKWYVSLPFPTLRLICQAGKSDLSEEGVSLYMVCVYLPTSFFSLASYLYDPDIFFLNIAWDKEYI